MSERKLVTIERVVAVRPIEGADAIEAATVRGWTVVIKKGELAVGDLCLYFEIDSFLPIDDARFAFLASRGTKTLPADGQPGSAGPSASTDERVGHVLKTAKLRGVVSQGLIVPIAMFPELGDATALAASGEDLAPRLGVVKYEPPVPAQLTGQLLGEFPTQFAPKTDAERVQNLVGVYDALRAGARWIATEKVDGTSVTYIRDAGRLRICSRNFELAPEGTTQQQLAEAIGLLDLLQDGDAVQAELFGMGIQKNPLKIKGQRLAIFGIWRGHTPLPRAQWPAPLLALAAPLYDLTLPDTVAAAVAQADGIRSKIAADRLAEGIVWHAEGGETFDVLDGRSCFKVISNKWLLRADLAD